MANPNKEDMNQNQHTNKARAASAGAGAHQPDAESLNTPEDLGGERPNPSNTGSMQYETGERLDLQPADEHNRQSDR